MNKNDQLLAGIIEGDFISIARGLTLVENELPDGLSLLDSLETSRYVPIIGITGPPGAGKSTLVNSLVDKFVSEGKKIAVIAVDPTSPFNLGSLLGDRIRMSSQFNNPN
ncbi:MAG: methylmalonyl Co-A mutase-associated GTPase MeaB, partial [Flavobacterium sp.]